MLRARHGCRRGLCVVWVEAVGGRVWGVGLCGHWFAGVGVVGEDAGWLGAFGCEFVGWWLLAAICVIGVRDYPTAKCPRAARA